MSWCRLFFAVVPFACIVESASAQIVAAPNDSARCDSVIAASRVDSVGVTIRARVLVIDGVDLKDDVAARMALDIGNALVMPRPFRLSVLSAGTATMRALRTTSAAKATPRAPTVTGIYRFRLSHNGPPGPVRALRMSLVPGLDAAVAQAIGTALAAERSGDTSAGSELEFRLTTDSLPGGVPLIGAQFPLMPVVDVVARPDNPAPAFPEEMKRDSVEEDVVLRFVVDRTGTPVAETVMLVRGSTPAFVRAALVALGKQRFSPATIGGCAVAQVVDFPFSFVLPKTPVRH